MSDDRFAKLPHDDHYGDQTWEYILGGGDGAVNHGLGYTGADQFDPEAVAEVIFWFVDVNEWDYGPEHRAAGVFRMVDGTFVAFGAWCDSTGWGCQDDARFTYHATFGEAVSFGLTDEERRWFGIEPEVGT